MTKDERDAVLVVLKAFDDGVFTRETSGDGHLGWAMRLVEPLGALVMLKHAADEAPVRPGVTFTHTDEAVILLREIRDLLTPADREET